MQPDLTAGDRAQIGKPHTSQQGVTTSTTIPLIHNKNCVHAFGTHTRAHTITKKKHANSSELLGSITNHLASNYFLFFIFLFPTVIK